MLLYSILAAGITTGNQPPFTPGYGRYRGCTIIQCLVNRYILAKIEIMFVAEPCGIARGAKQQMGVKNTLQIKLGGFANAQSIKPIYRLRRF